MPGPLAVRAVPGKGGSGIAVTGPTGTWSSAAPVEVLVTGPGEPAPRTLAVPYDEVVPAAGGGLRGAAAVDVTPGCTVRVVDLWCGGQEASVRRAVEVRGDAPGGFATAVTLARGAHGWAELEVLAPGLVYGDARPVSAWTIGGPDARAAGVRDVLVREDRLSAPHLTVRYPDGVALTVHRDGGTRATVAADGLHEHGGTLVDERVDLVALGGRAGPAGVAVGGTYPAAEGEWTYTSGGLPLTGLRAWRQTLHPLRDGLRHEVALGWTATSGGDRLGVLAHARDRAWTRYRPVAEPVPAAGYLLPVARVLASQVQRPALGLAGVALESDPLRGVPVPGASASVMGFVGAGTDVGLCLLRGAEALAAEALADEAADLAERGRAVLDAFARLPLDPPAGEGWDLVSGAPTTYRDLDGEPAVFARAVAEGCHAALRAAERVPAAQGGAWRDWALGGAAFLVDQQRPDGSFPRAWRAGTGAVLQQSPTATATVVPFLLAAGLAEAAVRAGEHAWARAAEHLAYAGATLDNPDVVDKEGALLAARAFLALHRRTGEDRWLGRALHAARVAESWVHLVDLPVPADAPWADLHWKPGRSMVGLQLITSGVTMSDGFLVVDAALFAELALRSGEDWPARVARLVHHGSLAMLATAQRPFDLAGAGWQQEHWGFGPRRGYGLNRHWLPWTAVAVLDGHFRLRDLGPEAAALVALDG
ncbi:hypothetical protein [Cellulomonas hominis]|uniref:hypothetical protein n=1 Tax=Cellulomonas hominis TaxID=156981 RepID=UPI001BD0A79F|nr:hypothetical protein [Cellulomonas hominis]